MARDYFPCRYSYRPILETFSDPELGRLFKALLKYGDTGERSDLPGKEAVAFEFMAADLDRANSAYDAKCKVLSENGKKGGRPKANGFSEKQTEPKESKEKPIKESKVKERKEKEDNIPPKSPQGERFERFWAAYPRKAGKGAARKAFEKVRVPVETLIAAVEAQKKSDQWTRDGGQYIPHPATWLNQERWNDELATPAQAEEQPAPFQPGEAELRSIQELAALRNAWG